MAENVEQSENEREMGASGNIPRIESRNGIVDSNDNNVESYFLDISDIKTETAEHRRKETPLYLSQNYESTRRLLQDDHIRFEAPAPTTTQCACYSRNTILIVDDNSFNIITIQTMIEYEFGLMCDKAFNGQEALDKIEEMGRVNYMNPCLCLRKRPNYRLVFMDCSMPIMDGFEAAKAIR